MATLENKNPAIYLSDISPWTDSFLEIQVLLKFPTFQSHWSVSNNSLEDSEREELDIFCKNAREYISSLSEENKNIVEYELHKKISLYSGDITDISIDVIVNASNKMLSTGKGVNGCIHTRAGPELLWECQTIGACDAGEAILTKGYKLPAKHVIHTVGPMENELGKKTVLEKCYVTCLRKAKSEKLMTLAFCCISTGMYCYPSHEAANIAIKIIHNWLLASESNRNAVERIIFVVRKSADHESYAKLLSCYFPVK